MAQTETRVAYDPSTQGRRCIVNMDLLGALDCLSGSYLLVSYIGKFDVAMGRCGVESTEK